MTIDYDEFMAEKWAKAKAMPLSQRNRKRGVKSRFRDPEEREAYFAMVRRRVRRAFETGEIVKTGPRKYRLKID